MAVAANKVVWRLVPFLILAAVPGAASAANITDPLAGMKLDSHLIHVPAHTRGAVYRDPDVSFAVYRQVIVDPVSVQFQRSWRRTNARLSEAQLERLRSQAATSLREELLGELVGQGKYRLAESAAPDVLRIRPSILDLKITAPLAGTQPGVRTYAGSTAEMVLMFELYDAGSGVLVGRIFDVGRSPQHRVAPRVDQVTIRAETRKIYASGAQLLREALNLAASERPRRSTLN